jgi:hypothetical protein
MWVAVPGGAVRDDVALLRALVVPRLTGLPDDASLADYGMEAWPTLVAGATFAVEVAADATGDPSPLDPRGVAPQLQHVRPERWPEVFPPDLRVRPFGLPPAYAAPVVEPTSMRARQLRQLYAEAAQPGSGNGIRRLAATDLGTSQVVPRPPDEDDFPPPEHPPPDFHRVVSMLREHPGVLRALGLLIEIEVRDLSGLGLGGLVRVVCTLPADAPALTHLNRWTSYTLAGHRFLPAPAPGSDITSGMLDLKAVVPDDTNRDPQPRWEIETFDVTGTLERARATRAAVMSDRADVVPAARPSDDSPPPPVDTGRLPAVRSAGLNVIRRQRQVVLEAKVGRALARTHDQLDVLDADDLVLGYRVDVRPADGEWQSLMLRQVTYRTSSGAELFSRPDEEGQIKANAVTVVDARERDNRGGTTADGRDARVTRGDEVVARWDGWSLAVARPVLQQRADRKQLDHLRWEQSPFGVPHLRFGEQYTLRVRIADAAGGGLAVGDPQDEEGWSHEVSYGRHEPVRPPYMITPPQALEPAPEPALAQDGRPRRHRPMGPGGSVDVLVIRSDPNKGKGVDAFAPLFPDNSRREFLPPQASFALVEQHGELDSRTDEECTELLARSLEPEAVVRTPAPGGGERVGHSWLPDPVAERMVVTLRPDGDDDVVLDVDKDDTTREAWALPGAQTWPDFAAKAVSLQPRAGSQQRLEWTQNHTTAAVRLHPAEDVVVAVSSTIRGVQASLFSMTSWLKDYRPDGDDGPDSRLPEDLIETIMSAVRDGRHGLVTPAHDLRMVHAVQHPLNDPQGELTATRQVGDTRAWLSGVDDPLLGLDVPSTGQVELVAAWTETVDRPDPARPDAALQETPVAITVQISRLDRGAVTLPELVHELGDTRHREISYTLTGTSRFGDFFETPDITSVPLTTSIHVPSSVRPPEPVVLSVAPAFRWFGTELPEGWTEVTRTRAGGGFRIALACPWLASGTDEQLAILLRADADTPPGHCTTVRRDPIYATPSPGVDPQVSVFRGSAAPSVVLDAAEGDGRVVAVPFTAQLSRSGGPDGVRHWYVDVDMHDAAESSYWPFVSLAVARYQPFSVEGQELSPAVRCEPVQLTPTRTLTVSRSGGRVTWSLTGLEQEFAQDAELLPHVGGQLTQTHAFLERLPAGRGHTDVTTANADLAVGWERLGGPVGGTFDLPEGDEPLRLVVREVQRYFGSHEAAQPSEEVDERVVFLDIVPLR